MMKILFIYGYGGNTDSTFCRLIRKGLRSDLYNVRCYEYPQEDCAKAKEYLEEIIKTEDIDLVIGTSLGGFITLALETDIAKIVINPCMRPSVELPLLKPRPDHPEDVAPSAEMIATYRPFEEAVNTGTGHQPNQVTGLFGQVDELLGTKYFKPFITTYGNARLIPGGHHGNKDAIPSILAAIADEGSAFKDSDSEHVKVYNGWYSSSIYEMETWVRRDDDDNWTDDNDDDDKWTDEDDDDDKRTDEEIVSEMQEMGYVTCACYKRMIGYYPTRERAEQDLDEMYDLCWDLYQSLDFAVIRQRVSYIQMNPGDYVKEWSYVGGLVEDETLVRNFDLENNPFMGRPKEMIRHKVGDIVAVFKGDDVHWGIVCGLPFTPEKVSEIANALPAPLDYSDDEYVIITANTGYDSHEHVPSHLVTSTDLFTPTPKKVVELLKEGLAKALD